MITIEQADKITQEWIESHVDLDKARASFAAYPFQRESDKLNRPEYKPGLWAMDESGEIFVLVEVNLDDIKPGEGDWEAALRYKTTQQYIEWFQAGYRPPPVFVVRNCHDGHLVCLNRRRWLAAREAGIKKMRAFYSPTTSTGRPAWQLRPCTLDRNRVCRVYARGGSCVTCNYYKENAE